MNWLNNEKLSRSVQKPGCCDLISVNMLEGGINDALHTWSWLLGNLREWITILLHMEEVCLFTRLVRQSFLHSLFNHSAYKQCLLFLTHVVSADKLDCRVFHSFQVSECIWLCGYTWHLYSLCLDFEEPEQSKQTPTEFLVLQG